MKYFFAIVLIFSLTGCKNGKEKSDAYGTFEAEEVLVSAEGNGKLLQLSITEGERLEPGSLVAVIDTSDLYLKKQQLFAQKDAILLKTRNIASEVQVLEEKKKVLFADKARIENLLKDGAATTKQLDDINGNINVMVSQIQSVNTQNANISGELGVVSRQVDQVNESIRKSYIRNPVAGTVLEKFAEAAEVVSYGKPLYSIANTDELILKVFVSGSQLAGIRVGQETEVLIDGEQGKLIRMKGRVGWISSKAEFTPKIIQTREERVNLVYAVKVSVKNDGSLKIGMPGEVNFR